VFLFFRGTRAIETSCTKYGARDLERVPWGRGLLCAEEVAPPRSLCVSLASPASLQSGKKRVKKLEMESHEDCVNTLVGKDQEGRLASRFGSARLLSAGPGWARAARGALPLRLVALRRDVTLRDATRRRRGDLLSRCSLRATQTRLRVQLSPLGRNFTLCAIHSGPRRLLRAAEG